MKYLSFLIKPASSLCNLRCTYCFYKDVSSRREIVSYGIMDEHIMRTLIDRAFEVIDDDGELTFAFQGGEPTLAGIDYYKTFTGYVEKKRTNQKICYALQTNGTLLDDEWGEFFSKNQFLIGVSLDGYEANTNQFRVDSEGRGMYNRILQGIEVLKRHQVDFNILSVITQKLSKHPKAFYKYMKSQGFGYIQCIPCLGELDGNTEQELNPDGYLRFYKELYELWAEDYRQGDYVSITLFDNLMLMLNDRPPQQCGMLGFCSAQFVVEADGSVYPCDFYVLDEYCCGNIIDNSIEELAINDMMQGFLKEEKKAHKICEDCPFTGICHGGCKRQNQAYLRDERCAHRELLNYILRTR